MTKARRHSLRKDAPKDDDSVLTPPTGGVCIRMYRQGLGDAFLLAFDGINGKPPSYMLIDCGVLTSQAGGRATMRQVLDNVAAATGGRLDVVVATHEHSDHVSAFVQEAERFLNGQLSIEHVWLAWTERDDDKMAKELRKGRAAARKAIEAALKRLQKDSSKRASLAALSGRITAADSFLGSRDAGTAYASVARRLGIEDPNKVEEAELALALLKNRAKHPPRFLEPGAAPEPVPGAGAARAYVLGPPRDEKLLRKSDPSKGTGKETYLTLETGVLSFATAALGANDPSFPAKQREACHPFDSRYRRKPKWRGTNNFFVKYYEKGQHNGWRQIETDWLFSAEELALDFDKHTNNTSLVLAIELGQPGTGPVLLFAADAQVGNWLSWKPLEWEVEGRSIELKDLLQRTLVYKVGHHASHNATLRRDQDGARYGLELMPEGLIALIPVDADTVKPLKGWHMPYKPLYETLKQKTGGNILRSDNVNCGLSVPKPEFTKVTAHPAVELRCSRTKKADNTPLYYDINIQP